ncbi:MAG: arginine--tRNA ligase [Bacteroidota bacterium]
MESILTQISQHVQNAVKEHIGQTINEQQIQIQKTRKDFNGDFTVVVFPLLKLFKLKPEQCAQKIGEYLVSHLDLIEQFNIVKGFLNLEISDKYWHDFLNAVNRTKNFGFTEKQANSNPIMVEYSSPNTNKPLHLGHIRNNLLGYAICSILQGNGYDVVKSNLVNDRGIHICKTMLAWQKWGQGETPESSNKKGDHLVGDYYVMFENKYKKQVDDLKANGMDEKEAMQTAPLIKEAREMLKQWEDGEEHVVSLWKKMNDWVYKGFDETYERLGVDFDKIYYESQTYTKGRDIVLKGLKDGVLEQQEDGSVWADLTAEGYDKKLLLRSDGTSVYMTQDIGTAVMRYEEYKPEAILYVVGNEQDYHFNILPLILKKLGYEWGDKIKHLSYGMVDLPSGKMKSREGKVVDADDLMDEMIETAGNMSQELGKLEGYSPEEKTSIINTIGMGALKYFILKVDPKKNMTFNPEESVDFNGNTGPFIQYTYARIQSVLRKARERNIDIPDESNKTLQFIDSEKEVLKPMHALPEVIAESGATFNPGIIANHIYELVKQYNQFYQDTPILRNDNEEMIKMRLLLSKNTAAIIKSSARLLGMDMPPRM